MRSLSRVGVVCVVLAVWVGGLTVPGVATRLAPTLQVEAAVGGVVTSGPAGLEVTLVGHLFTPGPATVLWDSSIRGGFLIEGGSFYRPFTIPAAPPGPHTITVCGSVYPLGSPCNSGEFAEKADVIFTVVQAVPPGGQVDYQIIAIEVTQGVRGVIPTRASNGPTLLPTDDAVHVANRPTVVRAYPWVGASAVGSVRPVTAYLQVQLADGTFSEPIEPVARLVVPGAGRGLALMRPWADWSFNFVLPHRFRQGGSRNFRVVINPAGPDHAPESVADSANNAVTLPGVRFRLVQGQPIDIIIYVGDTALRGGDGEVYTFLPSMPEISGELSDWLKLWPIDPSMLRISYRYIRCTEPSPPTPVPGYEPYCDDANVIIRNENFDLIQAQRAHRTPYSYIWFAQDLLFWTGGKWQEYWGPYFESGAWNQNLAHEAAHSVGRLHAGNGHREGEFGGFDVLYPGRHGEVEPHSMGFDVWEMRAVPPTYLVNGEFVQHMHDFLAYGDRSWVSIYTWEGLARVFDAPDINVGHYAPGSFTPGGSSGSSTEYLSLSGDVVDGDTVYLDPVFTVRHTQEFTAGGVAQADVDYTLTLRDAAGRVLVQRVFATVAGSQPGMAAFHELVPVVAGVAKLEISRQGRVIAERSVSPQPPGVRVLDPTPGDSWAGTGETVVRWEGSDSGDDRLTYRVQVSPDGQSWRTIVGATAENQAPVYLPGVPGSGPGWRLRVQASDGLNVTTAEVAGLDIAAKPPIPTVLAPAHRGLIPTGMSLDLLGQGYDLQDGQLPNARLQWLLDGNKVATGGSSTIGPLGAGEHTVALRATNSAGLQATTEVTLFVGADQDGDRLPDTWENQMGLSPTDAGDAIEDPDGDTVPNWQEFELGTSPRDQQQPGQRLTNEDTQPGPSGERLAPPQDQPLPLLLVGVALVVLLGLAGLWYRYRYRSRRSSVSAS